MIDNFYNDIFTVLLKFLTVKDCITLRKTKNTNIILLLKNNDNIFKKNMEQNYPRIVNKTSDSYLGFLQLLNTLDYCLMCNKYLNGDYVKFLVYYPKNENEPVLARYHKDCLNTDDIDNKHKIDCKNYTCPLTNDEVFGFISRNSI